MPFGFHGWDLLVVAVIALLIFGPKRLPEMGSAIGKTYKEFRKSMSEITEGKSHTAPVTAQIPPASSATQSLPTPAATEIPLESATSTTEQPAS